MKSGKIVFQGTSIELRQNFHCGYKLSFIFNDNIENNFINIFNYFKETKEDIIINPDNPNCSILVPINDEFPNFLEFVDSKVNELNIKQINVIVESLENVLLRLIQEEE